MAETIRTDGLRELERALRDLTPAIQGKKGFAKNPLRSAVRAMTVPVIEAARAKAPVDPETRTSIPKAIDKRLIPIKERDRFTTRGDSFEGYDVGYRLRSSAGVLSAWYAGFLELGTDKQPAQPFLRPALEENKDKAISAFKAKLGKDLDLIARKLRNRGRIR